MPELDPLRPLWERPPGRDAGERDARRRAVRAGIPRLAATSAASLEDASAVAPGAAIGQGWPVSQATPGMEEVEPRLERRPGAAAPGTTSSSPGGAVAARAPLPRWAELRTPVRSFHVHDPVEPVRIDITSEPQRGPRWSAPVRLRVRAAAGTPPAPRSCGGPGSSASGCCSRPGARTRSRRRPGRRSGRGPAGRRRGHLGQPATPAAGSRTGPLRRPGPARLALPLAIGGRRDRCGAPGLCPAPSLAARLAELPGADPAGPRAGPFGALTSLVPGTLPVGAGPGDTLVYHCLDLSQPVAQGLAADEALLIEAQGGGQAHD